MHLSILTSCLALATGISAQYYNVTSKPFQLILQSSNRTLNGKGLFACHEGAGIEGLCVGTSGPSSTSDTYNFNTTYQQQTNQGLPGQTGLVTWLLRGGNFNVSSSLQLAPSPTSDVAVPLFFPGDQGFSGYGFDKKDKLFVAGYLDNTVSPPVYKAQAYYRWYACITNAGYTYQTLAWAVGSGKPENPSCEKVDVKRVFI
ncbi:related to heatshock protein Hsp150 [Rhynchosporium agropyri]|uniref:Related to heatshock protein Hsp150 n=1 Tax=Rhynchosporium agropyri TaxID=914238 RepID=A0A1E1KI05_9HELO|nr:related to heatshock protein Hsp150 [Rhynchosporium agropyri]